MTVVVRSFDDLATVRTAYLQAVDAGAGELTVDLPAGVFGIDPGEVLGGLSLAGAGEPPPLHVTLRASDGRCVLAGIGVQVRAQRVTIENVAIVGTSGVALGVGATAAIELRDVVVLRAAGSERDHRAVELQAGGQEGTALSVERSLIARASAPEAVAGFICRTGAWWDAVTLTDTVISGGSSDALVFLDAVMKLRAQGCTLRAGDARTLLRLAWPVPDGELAGCRLSGHADALIEVLGEVPQTPPPLRLTEGTAVTAPLGELPDQLASDGAQEIAGATVDEAVEASIARVADELTALDERLADRVR